jgi:hypothetical protein
MSCALFRTHGKCLVCRAFFYRLQGKDKTHGKCLVCRALEKNAQQMSCLPCVLSIAHGKVFFSSFPTPNQPNIITFKTLCRAHKRKHTTNSCIYFKYFSLSPKCIAPKKFPNLEIFFYSIYKTCDT